MVMPGGMMGSQLAERLVQKSPKLKVIYTSGYNPGMARMPRCWRSETFCQAIFDWQAGPMHPRMSRRQGAGELSGWR
jgi:hypothetical protein